MKYTFNLLLCICVTLTSFAQSPCEPNIDFEQGNLNNWYLFTGSCCPITVNPSLPITGRHTITVGATTDMYGGFPVVDPTLGIYSMKLGNNINGGEAEQARYYVHVPSGSNNYSLIFRYAVVFEDPNHGAVIQPRFEVKAFDSASGAPITCAQFSFVASASLPGFTQSSLLPRPFYKPWTTASVDLSSMNGKTVALNFATGDCGAGGHFGYAYVDINCVLFETFGVDCLDGNLTTLSGPPGFQTYQWWDSAFTMLHGNGQTIQVATPSVTTTFAVVVTPFPGFGCSDTLFTTRKGSDLTVYAGKDTAICLLSGTKNIPLNAIGTSSISGIAYSWAPATGLSCTNCSNPVATVGGTMKYVVTVTDSSRCIRSDTVVVVAVPTVHAKLVPVKDTVCQNEEVWINNVKANEPGTIFSWTVDTGKITGTDTSKGHVKVRWTTTGLKKIIIRVANTECVLYDSVYVYVIPTPVSSFEMDKNGCINERIDIIPKQDDNAWYYWKVDEQIVADTIYKPKYNFTWNRIGNKNVSLQLVGKNGCVAPLYSSGIYIHEIPTATISRNPEEKLCFGDKISLSCNNKGSNYTYDWKPAVYFENNGYHEVVYKIEKAGTVTLNIIDQWGCTGSDSLLIKANMCCKVFMPDAFTPNADGINDTYKPIGIQYHRIHSFIIKNRWGQTVYSSENPNAAWDGTFKGTPQNVGTYNYFLKYICEEKEVIEEKGTFILIR